MLGTVGRLKEWWNGLLEVGRNAQVAETAAIESNTAAQAENATATGVNGERKRARGGFPLNLNIDNQGTGSMSPLLLLFGNLNNGSGNAGMSYSNRNNGLSNRNWNIGSRLFRLTVKALQSEASRLPA